MFSASVMTGFYVLIAMIALILIGVPIFTSMLSCALVGFMILGGPQMIITQFSSGAFTQSASYTFSVIPLFTLVGVLAGETGIAAGAFAAMEKWLGRFKGGLLYALVGANAVFGACTGVSTTGNMLFSKLAMPTLRERKYNEELSLGTICASGTLGVLIPPSIPCVVLCLMTGLSVGRALMYCLCAGLVFIVVLSLTIKVLITISPQKVPEVTEEDKSVPMKERLKSLKLLGPIVLLFALIVGGSYFGWFPATVGGAVAVVAIIIYALLKRMTLKDLWRHCWEGCQLFVSVFFIILSGQIFARFIAMTGLANELAALIATLTLHRYVIFLIIFVFYLFCGCFMHMMSMIIITMPVVYPLLLSLGFDPYPILVILVFTCELAMLTPPVGASVFGLANVMKMPTTPIFRGVMPFILAEGVMVLLIGAFPGIISWLPNLLG